MGFLGYVTRLYIRVAILKLCFFRGQFAISTYVFNYV